MPRLRAVWATTQLFLALGTVAWGLMLFKPLEAVAVWAPGGNFAAAAFFLVAALLFGRDHPDGRVVGLVGLVVFLITNGFLIWYAMDQELFGTAPGARVFPLAEGWGDRFPWVLGAGTALVAIPEALILLFGHKPLAPVEPETPETPAP